MRKQKHAVINFAFFLGVHGHGRCLMATAVHFLRYALHRLNQCVLHASCRVCAENDAVYRSCPSSATIAGLAVLCQWLTWHRCWNTVCHTSIRMNTVCYWHLPGGHTGSPQRARPRLTVTLLGTWQQHCCWSPVLTCHILKSLHWFVPMTVAQLLRMRDRRTSLSHLSCDNEPVLP